MLKRDKRKEKQKQKKNKIIIKQICESGAFRDCIQLVFENGSYSDGDLNNMCIVSKYWNKTIENLFKKIKKIEYTFVYEKTQFMLYGFVPINSEVSRSRDISAIETNDVPMVKFIAVELQTFQNTITTQCNIINVWTRALFSSKVLRDNTVNLYDRKVIYNYSDIDAIDMLYTSTNTYRNIIDGSLRIKFNDLVPKKDITQTAFQKWAISQSAHLK